MYALAVILLFIAFPFPLAGGSLRPEQESDFWKDSGASPLFAKSVINDKDCGSSEQYFDFCRKALFAGASIQGLSRQAEFKQLQELSFDPNFKFEPLLEEILASNTTQNIEWLVGRMINAHIKIFDPYSQLVPQAYYDYLSSGGSKSYYGNGIEAHANSAGLFIFSVVPNSSAERAGLRVHDHIVAVNGERIGPSLAKVHGAIGRVSGHEGGKLLLDIERGGRTFTVEVMSSPIVIPGHSFAKIDFNGETFLHVRLRAFSRGTCDFLASTVWRFNAEKALAGLILDLRQNRGGLTEEGECVVRLFADRCKQVVIREPLRLSFPHALDSPAKALPSNAGDQSSRAVFPHLKLTILIDAKSASASEIVAGALQDFERAWVVGERSYGKGMTQIVRPVQHFPKLMVSKTVSRYMRPSGLSVHGLGVTPNFEEPYRLNASASERQALREENTQSMARFIPGKRWVETRARAVMSVRACLSEDSLASRAEEAILNRFHYPDHQTAVALSILKCAH